MKRILIVIMMMIFGASGVLADDFGQYGYQDRQKPPERVKERDKQKPDDNNRNRGSNDKKDDKKDNRRRPD